MNNTSQQQQQQQQQQRMFMGSMMGGDMGLGFHDKRNRNPNWTDHEIVRFLEILQEEDTLRDLVAQRNKQVFCYVAQRMTQEGSEKTWDQCRIKLKNLKSQYRYVKDRIPNIDEVDLEDDDVIKQLITECQGRGISPSNIKHLRFLKRFLEKTASLAAVTPMVRGDVFRGRSNLDPSTFLSTELVTGPPQSSPLPNAHSRPMRLDKSLLQYQMNEHEADDNLAIENGESVSPPSTPLATNVKILHENDNDDGEPTSKKSKKDGMFGDFSQLSSGSLTDGYKFIERFNREMMEQFLEYQRKSSSSFVRWEQERYRQEQVALEHWRQEAREHEKQMFGIFCTAISQCNMALTTLLKAKQDAQDATKKIETATSSAASSPTPSSGKQSTEQRKLTIKSTEEINEESQEVSDE